MIFTIICLLQVLLCITFHLILNRFLGKIKKYYFWMLFPAGFIFNLLIQIQLNSPYILTTSVTFITLVFSYFVFFSSTSTGEDSPSAIIHRSLSVAPDFKMNKNEILSLFTEGLIEKHNRFYKISPKGLKIAKIVNLYRRLLGWRMGG